MQEQDKNQRDQKPQKYTISGFGNLRAIRDFTGFNTKYSPAVIDLIERDAKTANRVVNEEDYYVAKNFEDFYLKTYEYFAHLVNASVGTNDVRASDVSASGNKRFKMVGAESTNAEGKAILSSTITDSITGISITVSHNVRMDDVMSKKADIDSRLSWNLKYGSVHIENPKIEVDIPEKSKILENIAKDKQDKEQKLRNQFDERDLAKLSGVLNGKFNENEYWVSEYEGFLGYKTSIYSQLTNTQYYVDSEGKVYMYKLGKNYKATHTEVSKRFMKENVFNGHEDLNSKKQLLQSNTPPSLQTNTLNSKFVNQNVANQRNGYSEQDLEFLTQLAKNKTLTQSGYTVKPMRNGGGLHVKNTNTGAFYAVFNNGAISQSIRDGGQTKWVTVKMVVPILSQSDLTNLKQGPKCGAQFIQPLARSSSSEENVDSASNSTKESLQNFVNGNKKPNVKLIKEYQDGPREVQLGDSRYKIYNNGAVSIYNPSSKAQSKWEKCPELKLLIKSTSAVQLGSRL